MLNLLPFLLYSLYCTPFRLRSFIFIHRALFSHLIFTLSLFHDANSSTLQSNSIVYVCLNGIRQVNSVLMERFLVILLRKKRPPLLTKPIQTKKKKKDKTKPTKKKKFTPKIITIVVCYSFE